MINRINEVLWFTPGNGKGKCIGIVLLTDAITNQPKAYIGLGDGEDEKADIEMITDYGAQFHYETADWIAAFLKEQRMDVGPDDMGGGLDMFKGWSVDRF